MFIHSTSQVLDDLSLRLRGGANGSFAMHLASGFSDLKVTMDGGRNYFDLSVEEGNDGGEGERTTLVG